MAPSIAGAPCPAGVPSAPQVIAPEDPSLLEAQKGSQKNAPGAAASTSPQLEARSFVELAECLVDLGLPPLEDRSATPRTNWPARDCTTVVFLSEPENRLSQCLEGGRQAPGHVLMAMSPSWLEKRARKDGNEKEGFFSLFVHKAVWFDKVGQSYLDVFQPPRQVTYFANFMTMPGTDGVRDDGIPLEGGLDCPMSSSCVLEQLTNDKLHTRMLLAKARVAHPACCAFTYLSKREYNLDGVPSVLSVTPFSSRDGNRAALERDIARLSARLQCPQLVVKPSGPMWMGSAGVSFHARADTEGLAAAAEELLGRLWPGDCILVEEFIPTLNTREAVTGHDALSPTHAAGSEALDSQSFSMADDEDVDEEGSFLPALSSADAGAREALSNRKSLGFRLRVMVARAPWGSPVVTKMLCGVGHASRPINGSNTLPMSLAAVLEQWGVTTPVGQGRITGVIAADALKCMQALMDHEATLSPAERGGPGALTDLIGIDFIITATQRGIVPVVIEVNDHDCSLQAQTLEFMTSDAAGESVRTYVASAVARSQSFILKNRKFLVVGAGGYSKKFVWDGCAANGVSIVLVDDNPDHFARALVSDFVVLEGMSDHKRDAEHADAICAQLRERGIKVEGCLTFWEDCGPLAALVAERLGLPGNAPAAQSLAKSKFDTQAKLMTLNVERNHVCTTSMFASRVYRPETEADIRRAWAELGGAPAVLKLEFGSSACGVVLVRTLDECLAQWAKIRGGLSNEEDHRGIGLGFGSSVVLMEYVDGSEHDVDIVMHAGQVVGAFVTDNGPTRVPLFCETAAAMPSRLHRDVQSVMVSAAAACCRGLGLRTGVFNVELKQTGCGPKLLEVNARMGGFYIRDWVQRVWGVDLLKANLLLALGLRPILFPASEPRVHMVGRMIYGSMDPGALAGSASLERLRELHNSGALVLNQLEAEVPGPDSAALGVFEEPFASIGCAGANKAAAKAAMLTLWRVLGLEAGDRPCRWYLKNL